MTRAYTFILALILFSSVGYAKSKSQVVLVAYSYKSGIELTAKTAFEGVRLALKVHGEKPAPYQFEKLDLEDNLVKAADATIAAILKYKPVAIIGTLRSDQALVVSEAAEKYKIPFITPFATNPKVTEGKKYTFRTCFDDFRQGKLFARYILKSQKLKTGTILYSNRYSFSIGFKEQFEKEFEAAGGKIVNVQSFTDENDFTPEFISQLAAVNSEFVLLPSYQIEAAAVLSRIVEKLPKSVKYFGPDSWGGGNLFHELLAGKNLHVSGYYVQHYSGESKTPANLEFLAQLRKHPIEGHTTPYGDTAMNAPVALMYDLTWFMIKAMGNQHQFKSLTEAIRHTRHEGAAGTIDFSRGPTARKPLYIYRIDEAGETFEKAYEAN